MFTPDHPPLTLTPRQVTLVAELFDVTVDIVGLLLKDIFEDVELNR